VPVGQVKRITPFNKGNGRALLGRGGRRRGGSNVQWNIQLIRADQCWNQTNSTGSGITLATIDGGVNSDHEALNANYRGTIDQTHDYNWADYCYQNKQPTDSDGHGTNVQGIASAGKGYGVAPGTDWITARIYNYAGYASHEWTIEGVQWAMCPTPVNQATPTDCSKGADVVSCSWGEDNDHAPYLEQYIKAWLKAEMVPVFAVGNYGGKCKTSVSPADYAGVIGVGGTDKSDQLLEFSSRGPATNVSNASSPLKYNPMTPAIVAPGLNIEGPSPSGDGYKSFSGTSQAAPHVAGVVALALSSNPKLSVEQVSTLVLHSADTASLQDPAGSDSCGGIQWDKYPNYVYGYGRVDALAVCTNARYILGEL